MRSWPTSPGEEMKMRKVRVDMVIAPGTMIVAPGISLRIEASRPRATRAACRSGGYHTSPAGRRTAREGKRQTSSLHAIARCGHRGPRGLARRERAHSEKTSDSAPAEVTEWPPKIGAWVKVRPPAPRTPGRIWQHQTSHGRSSG